MGKKSGEIKETAQQKALADIGMQQVQDFKQRWAPKIKQLSEGVVAAGAPGSFERRRAAAMGLTDTAARFAGANEKLDKSAAQAGVLGSSKNKLAITGMGGDQATSAAHSAVAADQSADNNYVAGLQRVTALARGEKANALNGLAQSAASSGRQAAADAEISLQNRIGEAAFAGKLIGGAAGLYQGMPSPSGIGSVPGGYIDPETRVQFNNPSAYSRGG